MFGGHFTDKEAGMTPDQISQAIATALSDAGEQIPEGTLAAVLPIVFFKWKKWL